MLIPWTVDKSILKRSKQLNNYGEVWRMKCFTVKTETMLVIRPNVYVKQPESKEANLTLALVLRTVSSLLVSDLSLASTSTLFGLCLTLDIMFSNVIKKRGVLVKCHHVPLLNCNQ